MKKNTLLSIFPGTLLLLAVLVQQSSAQTWTPVGSPGFSASGSGVCNWQHLLVAPDNTLYLAYNDEGFGLNSGEGTIMKFNGTSWDTVGAPGFTPGIAHHSSFNFGHGDTLYYSFADGTATGFSRGAVMMFDGTSWTSIGSNLTVGECQYSNIAMDSSGNLFFGAIDNGIGNGAMIVKKYNGNSTWSDVGSPSPVSDTNGAAYGCMRLDRYDTLYVAYQDKSELPGMVRVKKFDGTNWVNVGSPMLAITGPGAIAAMDIYLAFDIANTPYVSYSHGFQGPPRLSVEKFNGTDWELVGPAQFSSGTYETSLFSSLALPKDAPYVAYQHGGLNNKASVMKYNNLTSTWEHVGPDAISDSTAAFTSIALDGNGNVYVALFDGSTDPGKNTVLKYTVCEAPTIQSVTASQNPVCHSGDTVTLSVTGTLNDATSWRWYAGSCNNGTYIGSGATLPVVPTSGTTYFVRGLGNCVVSGGCSSVTIDMAVPKPTIAQNGNILTSSSASGNQWYQDGTAINGANQQSYTTIQPGWYLVEVTDGNCTNRSDSLYIEPEGIYEIVDKGQVHIFPVPFSQNLNINIDATIKEMSQWSLQITDDLGRVVYQQKKLEQRNTVDLSRVAQGIYFINIQTPEGNKAFKVLHQQ